MNTLNINFNKLDGLIPVCIQDQDTMRVLMIGFMNEEALQQTMETGQVTFYSRTKKRLWTKGETSGNFLNVVNLTQDCDDDSLLIVVKRTGPVCHTGHISCFKDLEMQPPLYWLGYLNQIIQERRNAGENSYTSRLLASGINRIAQKVGEESVEVVIAAVSDNQPELVNEIVDLFYHVFVLLCAKQVSLQTIAEVIQGRSNE